ncbi:MAG: hypothetical protein IT480_04915 [Gammaproteobacteria bacterium]|nr:hypothetical protein [Gammaproteobacteria bacterium]
MERLRAGWDAIRSCFAVLALIRFSLLTPSILLLSVVATDQMADILRALGEDGRLIEGALLLAMAAFAGLVVWYAARTMLRFRFAGCAAAEPDIYPRLKRHLPRLLGIAVPGILALRVALLAPASAASGRLLVFALALACVAAAVGLYVYRRRELARLPYLTVLAEHESCERRDLTRFGELPAVTRRVFFALLVANALCLTLFLTTPVWRMGASAILLLGLGLTAAVGSALVYMANHYGVPILTLMALWLALCSLNNDNHAVRRTATDHSHSGFARAGAPARAVPRAPLPAGDVERYFALWWQDLLRREGGEGMPGAGAGTGTGAGAAGTGAPVPVFVVAAEGGGIRAAYWSASVLTALEDASATTPARFSRHLFAISGVSGGSLGGATFAALVADAARDGRTPRLPDVEGVLGADFLSPTLGAAIFPDLLQRYLPVPLFDDRAVALEQSWERAWRTARPRSPGRFAAPFAELWARDPYRVPLLFLNATVVETGQRAIVAPLGVAPDASGRATFADALDAGAMLGGALPLSSAVHLSARFTYLSPAGLVDTGRPGVARWLRLVDGGYFDNSGAVTAAEIVDAVLHAHAALGATRPIQIIVLHLPNEPVDDRAGIGAGGGAGAGGGSGGASGGREFLGEVLDPVRALLATRVARGTQAVEALRREHERVPEVRLLSLAPCRTQAPLPLGWVLSAQVRHDLRAQVLSCSGVGAGCAAERIAALRALLASGDDAVLEPFFDGAPHCG